MRRGDTLGGKGEGKVNVGGFRGGKISYEEKVRGDGPADQVRLSGLPDI
jgi:hypothetical protein